MTERKPRIDLREIPKKKIAKKTREDLEKIQEAFGDEAEVVPAEKGILDRIKDAREEDDEYSEPDADWDDEEGETSESEVVKFSNDFTAGDKGISGKTDLTPIQAVLLTQFRILQEAYNADTGFDLGIEKFPEWFETYRLSIGRGSRKETVDIFRGKLDVGGQKDTIDGFRSPNRF